MPKDLNDYRSQHDSIRAEFTKQAASWGRDAISADLAWAVERLPLEPGFRVLDVAAGTGLASRAIAPRVAEVVAVDITPEMLAQGRRQAEREGVANVRFEFGAAEDLPFQAESFDMVVTRFSIHHFQSPGVAVREMARVCRPGGAVSIIDIVSPGGEELAVVYNRLERQRDPSHTRALSGGELARLIEESGLRIAGEFHRDVRNSLDEWLDRTQTPQSARIEILASLRRELDGGPPTGMRPFAENGRLFFLHEWNVVLGVKPGSVSSSVPL